MSSAVLMVHGVCECTRSDSGNGLNAVYCSTTASFPSLFLVL